MIKELDEMCQLLFWKVRKLIILIQQSVNRKQIINVDSK